MRPLEDWAGFQEAMARSDWDAVAAYLAPDVRVFDHRAMGLVSIDGRDALVAYLMELRELVPDVRPHTLRVLRESDEGFALELTMLGTGLEIPVTLVADVSDGVLTRGKLYELGDERAG